MLEVNEIGFGISDLQSDVVLNFDRGAISSEDIDDVRFFPKAYGLLQRAWE